MSETEFYASSNGDSWVLLRDADEAPVEVEHRPNAASGGRRARMGIDVFLADPHPGPQHEALEHLLAAPRGRLPATDIEVRRLEVGEEVPEHENYVLVMHCLSGEVRIVLCVEGMAQVSGRDGVALPSETFHDSATASIERARALAAEHGISVVYVREDP